MNRVAIIVLNWNGIKDTLECLDSLLKQSYKDFRIVVVDNGSTDDSRQLLDKYSTKNSGMVDVVYNTINFGFAGGVNTGIEWALNDSFDYVALFNNDAVADKDWLKELVRSSKPKDIGVTTGLLLRSDGKTIDTTGEQYSVWGLPFPRGRDDKRESAPKGQLVFGASGGASLYKTSMLRKIGFFDEDFFAYYEDTDVSFRAQLAGWKIAYNPNAVAYHKQGETSKKIPGFTVYQTFKNLPLLFIKNVPRGLLFSIGPKFDFAYTMMFFNAIKSGNGKPAIKGFAKSLLLIPKALSQRRNIQKTKVVTNEYIKSILWHDLPPNQTGLRKLRKITTGKS